MIKTVIIREIAFIIINSHPRVAFLTHTYTLFNTLPSISTRGAAVHGLYLSIGSGRDHLRFNPCPHLDDRSCSGRAVVS